MCRFAFYPVPPRRGGGGREGRGDRFLTASPDQCDSPTLLGRLAKLNFDIQGARFIDLFRGPCSLSTALILPSEISRL